MPIPPRKDMVAYKYFRTSQRYLLKLKGVEQQLDGLSSYQGMAQDEYKEYSDLLDEHEEIVPIVIVFAAMSLEAFFYDYATSKNLNPGKKKYENKVDSWLRIVKESTGKNFLQQSEILLLLYQLISARNKLVHAESSSDPVIDTRYFDENKYEEGDEYEEDDFLERNGREVAVSGATFYDVCANAVKTVESVMQELDKIDADKPSRNMFEHSDR